jgi:hypothetical protein
MLLLGDAEVRARLARGRIRVWCDVAGTSEEYRLVRLSSGGHNEVFGVVGHETVLVRVSLAELSRSEQASYRAEIAVQRRLAAMSLSPRVHATLRFAPSASSSGAARLGMVMERFTCALDELVADARRCAEFFVAHRGERLVVDLLLRAGAAVSCVDTKAANVVVRLGAEPRAALIDVDVAFCGVRAPAGRAEDEAAATRPNGLEPLEALASALGAYDAGDRTERVVGACKAAVSLVILCLDMIVNGGVNCMVATTAMMYENVHVLMRLLHEDEMARYWRDGRSRLLWMGARMSAISQIRYYVGIRTAAVIPRLLQAANAQRHTRLLQRCVAAGDAAAYVAGRRRADAEI